MRGGRWKGREREGGTREGKEGRENTPGGPQWEQLEAIKNAFPPPAIYKPGTVHSTQQAPALSPSVPSAHSEYLCGRM